MGPDDDDLQDLQQELETLGYAGLLLTSHGRRVNVAFLESQRGWRMSFTFPSVEAALDALRNRIAAAVHES